MKEDKPKIKESDLAEKFIQFFSGGYDVYPEVPAIGIIDIVAVREPIVVAVECKMQFGFEVLEQAIKNKSFAHYSYIAIPKPKIGLSYLKEQVCKNYGVGVLTFNFDQHTFSERSIYSYALKGITEDDLIAGKIREVIAPKLNRRIRKPKLNEWMKKSVAGSQHDRMTAFKNTVEEIERLLIRKGEMNVNDALSAIKHHYGSISSAKSSLSGLCRSGVIKSFTIENGLFKLKQAS